MCEKKVDGSGVVWDEGVIEDYLNRDPGELAKFVNEMGFMEYPAEGFFGGVRNGTDLRKWMSNYCNDAKGNICAAYHESQENLSTKVKVELVKMVADVLCASIAGFPGIIPVSCLIVESGLDKWCEDE